MSIQSYGRKTFLSVTLIGLGFFDMYKFGEGDTDVSGHITTKFCTGVDHHSVCSNIKNDFQKSNDVIGNEVIMLRSLSFCRKIHTKNTFT